MIAILSMTTINIIGLEVMALKSQFNKDN